VAAGADEPIAEAGTEQATQPPDGVVPRAARARPRARRGVSIPTRAARSTDSDRSAPATTISRPTTTRVAPPAPGTPATRGAQRGAPLLGVDQFERELAGD
ncbi:MAG: hypothetical protein M3Y87_00150, partial [Myxococcota bacterium]|nr:hypothetical protein [Myxococcota bacterium]